MPASPLITRLLTRTIGPTPPPRPAPRPTPTPKVVAPDPRLVHAVPPVATSVHAPNLPLRTTPAWHLARRAAQAPTAAMVADIERMGTRAWIAQQLAPASIPDPTWDGIVQRCFPWLNLTNKQVQDLTGGSFRGSPVMAHANAARPLFTNRVLWENVVTMWGDLLYVPYRSKADSFTLEYDWKVLRRHAFGRYADLLHAAVTHPAILHNLDNDANSRDNPNENLGREILELYSVGVGSYTETDVRQSALLLTGHSVDWNTRAYAYDDWAHHVGPIRIMGFSHANATSAGGPAALRAYTDYLARHPTTARRLARVLATRFVSDTPSEALVQTLASTYLASDTAIVPVLRRLFDHPEFWASVGNKWSRPAELAAKGVRASKPTGYAFAQPITTNPWAMSNYFWFLYQCGHAPRDWPRVDGYPDDADAWRSTIATLSSWNVMHALAWGWGDGPTYPDEADQDPGQGLPHWHTALGVKAGDRVLATARRITFALTGYVWREQDIAPIASWLCSYGERPATASDVLADYQARGWLREAVRLILASPYSFLR